MVAAEQMEDTQAPEEQTAAAAADAAGPINVGALKEAMKRVVAANRKIGGREDKIAAKRADIEKLDAAVRNADDRDEMNAAMKKLNRAHAALDRIIETGHSNTDDLSEALEKLAELATSERGQL